KNAGGGPLPIPGGVIPVNPGGVPGGLRPAPGVHPVVDETSSDDTLQTVAIVGGAALALGALWWVLSK
ncbi:MAG: hypothetical protein WKG32_20990, partial [Gemmatimonadaceae bacterium]